MHQFAKKGFPLCKPLYKILSKSSNAIYRGEQIEKLAANIKFIENELRKMEFDLNHGTDVIKDHCIELRRQVQLATELKIQELNQANKRLIKQIDDFETECINNYNKWNKTKHNRYNKRLNEYKIAHEESSKYLQNVEINEKTVILLNTKSNELKSKLAFDKQEIESFIFNEKILRFKASTDSDLTVGELRLISLNQIDFKNLKKCDLTHSFRKQSRYLRIGILADGSFVIANGSSRLKLSVCNEFSLIKTKIIDEFLSLNNMFVSNDKIVIQYRKNRNERTLKLFNATLEVLEEIDNFPYMLIGLNEHYIFAGSSSNHVTSLNEPNRLIIYNYSFHIVKTIGQKEDPFG